MSDLHLVLFGLGALVAMMLSAMFSGIETGLYTINRVRLAVRASHGDRRALRLQRYLANPNRMLSTLLVGNNLVHYGMSFCIAAIIDSFHLSPGSAIAINAAVVIPVLFIFGETLPKDLFRTYTDRWSYSLAGFLTVVEKILLFTGLVPLVQTVGNFAAKRLGTDDTAGATARQRMSQLIKEGMGAGVLTEAQTTLADRALSIRDRTVQSVMVPWKRMLCIAPDAGQQARELHIRYRSYTRLPVVDHDGRVAGILSLLDALLEPQKSTRELMTPPLIFEPDTPLREALRRMREERQPMAIVAQPGKPQPIGLVTIKDLIEPLTGELGAW